MSGPDDNDSSSGDPWSAPTDTALNQRKLIRKRRADFRNPVDVALFAQDAESGTATHSSTFSTAFSSPDAFDLNPLPVSLPTTLLTPPNSVATSSQSSQVVQQTTDRVFSNSAQAEDPVKTQTAKITAKAETTAKVEATASSKQVETCTPSPTSSLAPSASMSPGYL